MVLFRVKLVIKHVGSIITDRQSQFSCFSQTCLQSYASNEQSGTARMNNLILFTFQTAKLFNRTKNKHFLFFYEDCSPPKKQSVLCCVSSPDLRRFHLPVCINSESVFLQKHSSHFEDSKKVFYYCLWHAIWLLCSHGDLWTIFKMTDDTLDKVVDQALVDNCTRFF